MKRIYMLTLAFLLVFHGIGIGLAAGEERSTPGLSQFLDSPTDTSSSQHSILDEESMDYDPEDDSQLEPATEKANTEAVPEVPEHLSGPMNADLRDRLNTDVVDPSTTVSTNLADDTDENSDREEDRELPVSSETTVDTDHFTESKTETGELEVELDTNQNEISSAVAEVAEPGTDFSEVVSDAESSPGAEKEEKTPIREEKAEQVSAQQKHQENTPEPVQNQTVTSAQKPAVSSKSANPAQEKSPHSDSGQNHSTAPSMEQPAKPDETSETIPDESDDSADVESEETIQVSRTDELAKQKGLLPKMNFLFKEFGKWIGELIDSVESIF